MSMESTAGSHPVEIARADEALSRGRGRGHREQSQRHDIAQVDQLEAETRQGGDRAAQELPDRCSPCARQSSSAAGVVEAQSRHLPSDIAPDERVTNSILENEKLWSETFDASEPNRPIIRPDRLLRPLFRVLSYGALRQFLIP